MCILALARFRFLRTIRAAHPVFAIALIAAAVPMLLRNEIFAPAFVSWWNIRDLMPATAFTVQLVYLIHVIVIVSACGAFGTGRRAVEGQNLLDLTETAPVTSANRFFGDAAGILGGLLAVHVCVSPLLALSIALSPLPTATFFWLEAVTLALAVFVSAAASWNLHANTRWQQTRPARSFVTFGALAVGVLIFTTRWQPLADAAWFYFVQPSAMTWRSVELAVTNGPMLLVSMFLLYAGFIGYYALQSVRFLERR